MDSTDKKQRVLKELIFPERSKNRAAEAAWARIEEAINSSINPTTLADPIKLFEPTPKK